MAVVMFGLLIITVVTDIFGEPPTYLVGLLGTAAGAFFSAISSDKSKRDAEVSRAAHRAEAKVDAIEHRVDEGDLRADASDRRADESERRAGRSETRETEWSQHRDHHQDDDGGGGSP